MRKLPPALALLSVALLRAGATGAWANSIPPQVTLSSSNRQRLLCQQWRHTELLVQRDLDTARPRELWGNALLDPQAVTGKYWTWMVGSAPTLTRNPNDYDVNQGSTTTWLEVMLGINGSLGDPIGSVALSDVYRGMSSYPAFGGTIATSVSTLTFFADFSPPPSERSLTAFRGFLFAASASALLWGLCLTALADGLEEVAFL